MNYVRSPRPRLKCRSPTWSRSDSRRSVSTSRNKSTCGRTRRASTGSSRRSRRPWRARCRAPSGVPRKPSLLVGLSPRRLLPSRARPLLRQRVRQARRPSRLRVRSRDVTPSPLFDIHSRYNRPNTYAGVSARSNGRHFTQVVFGSTSDVRRHDNCRSSLAIVICKHALYLRNAITLLG